MAIKGINKLTRNFMFRDVSGKIRQLIEDKNLWGEFLAPERELAEAFGVSRDTVRKGLEELEREGLIIRRQGLGTQVRPVVGSGSGPAAGRVLIGSPGGSSSFFMNGVAEAAGSAGWVVSYANLVTPAGRSGFLSQAGSGSIDGVVLISTIDAHVIEEVQAVFRGPLVAVDHNFPGMAVTCVMEDCAGGIRQAMEHLLARGHRRIGLVEQSRRELNPWKYQGYVEALAAAGIPLDESLVTQSSQAFASGQRAGEQLLAVANPPTAVVTSDDYLAWGVWRAAEKAGLKVGRDFALVGYGDNSAVSGLGHELSSIHYDPVELGRVAMQQLIDLDAGRRKPGETILLPTRLIVRSSSGDARPGGGQAVATRRSAKVGKLHT